MSIYEEIKTERDRQDRQWGGAAHDDRIDSVSWVNLATKHLGRLAQYAPYDDISWRRQLVKLAALLVAALESYDRASARKEKEDADASL